MNMINDADNNFVIHKAVFKSKEGERFYLVIFESRDPLNL